VEPRGLRGGRNRPAEHPPDREEQTRGCVWPLEPHHLINIVASRTHCPSRRRALGTASCLQGFAAALGVQHLITSRLCSGGTGQSGGVEAEGRSWSVIRCQRLKCSNVCCHMPRQLGVSPRGRRCPGFPAQFGLFFVACAGTTSISLVEACAQCQPSCARSWCRGCDHGTAARAMCAWIQHLRAWRHRRSPPPCLPCAVRRRSRGFFSTTKGMPCSRSARAMRSPTGRGPTSSPVWPAARVGGLSRQFDRVVMLQALPGMGQALAYPGLRLLHRREQRGLAAMEMSAPASAGSGPPPASGSAPRPGPRMNENSSICAGLATV
jgi:hypothetical protein